MTDTTKYDDLEFFYSRRLKCWWAAALLLRGRLLRGSPWFALIITWR